MPYDGRHGGSGRGHRHDHDRFGFNGFYGWAAYPYLPWWEWGYPYLFNDWDYGDDYDAQRGNYASQPYAPYAPGPYDQPSDPGQPQPAPSYPQPDHRPAPSAAPVPLNPGAPVTLVFKDGHNEQIHNYLLTPSTLSVLDAHHRDIPVEQIDVAATTALNHQAGVDFGLPSGAR